jgi:hypothetical protein
MAPGSYQTYAYARGRDTVIKGTCQSVGCIAYAKGWDSVIDESTELGKSQADYIRHSSGRTFKELKDAAGLTIFRFEAFQRCFTDHRTVPEKFYVRKGDWRQNQGLIRRHVNGLDWAEDCSEQLDRIKTRIERG